MLSFFDMFSGIGKTLRFRFSNTLTSGNKLTVIIPGSIASSGVSVKTDYLVIYPNWLLHTWR
jgi:hypothetical protein